MLASLNKASLALPRRDDLYLDKYS